MDDVLSGVPSADAARMRQLHCISSATSVTALHGGITNRNYRVCTPEGDKVVRLSDQESALLAIDRKNEYFNSLAAAQAGVGARVDQYIPGAGVLVVDWIEGSTLSPTEVADPATLSRIADACQRLHRGPRFATEFNMFHVQAGYRRLIAERGFRLPEHYDDFADHMHRIQLAMAIHPEPLAPCNNDLLAANILDDGKALWLIDYEYSGNNEPSFELGNIWSESDLEDGLLEHLTGEYWGLVSASTVARARLWAVMSKYGWTLWGAIQDAISPIEFDYWAWGLEKFQRAVDEFRAPEFDQWLEQVAFKG